MAWFILDISIQQKAWQKSLQSSYLLVMVTARALFVINRKCSLWESVTSLKQQDSRYSVQDAKKCIYQSVGQIMLTEHGLERVSRMFSWQITPMWWYYLQKYISMNHKFQVSNYMEKEDRSSTNQAQKKVMELWKWLLKRQFPKHRLKETRKSRK